MVWGAIHSHTLIYHCSRKKDGHWKSIHWNQRPDWYAYVITESILENTKITCEVIRFFHEEPHRLPELCLWLNNVANKLFFFFFAEVRSPLFFLVFIYLSCSHLFTLYFLSNIFLIFFLHLYTYNSFSFSLLLSVSLSFLIHLILAQKFLSFFTSRNPAQIEIVMRWEVGLKPATVFMGPS